MVSVLSTERLRFQENPHAESQTATKQELHETLHCSKCRKILPIDSFSKTTNSRGRQYWCKSCVKINKASKKKREGNEHKNSAVSVRPGTSVVFMPGVTPIQYIYGYYPGPQYWRLLRFQNGAVANADGSISHARTQFFGYMRVYPDDTHYCSLDQVWYRKCNAKKLLAVSVLPENVPSPLRNSTIGLVTKRDEENVSTGEWARVKESGKIDHVFDRMAKNVELGLPVHDGIDMNQELLLAEA